MSIQTRSKNLLQCLLLKWYDFLLSCFISLQVTHYLGSEKEGYQTLMNIVMSEAYFANSFVFLLCGTIYLLNSFHYKASAAETTRQIAATPAPVLGIRDG